MVDFMVSYLMLVICRSIFIILSMLLSSFLKAFSWKYPVRVALSTLFYSFFVGLAHRKLF